VSGFDRIYGTPLFSIRSFLRSVVISIVICIVSRTVFSIYFSDAIVAQKPDIVEMYEKETTFQWLYYFFIGILVPVIVSDYLSLFSVRKILSSISLGPFKSCLLAFALGVLTILASYVVTFAGGMAVIGNFDVGYLSKALQWILGQSVGTHFFLFAVTMYPALFVHLWLVVFVVALSGARLGYAILRAVEWAEWLLKQGDQHPFKAIGVIGAVLAFVVVELGKHIAQLL
jgi:hypothetical protein